MSITTPNLKGEINDLFWAVARLGDLVGEGVTLEGEVDLLVAGAEAVATAQKAQAAIRSALASLANTHHKEQPSHGGGSSAPLKTQQSSSALDPPHPESSGATNTSTSKGADAKTIPALAPITSLHSRSPPSAASTPGPPSEHRIFNRGGVAVRARAEAKELFTAFLAAVLPLRLASYNRHRSDGLRALDARPAKYVIMDKAVEALRREMRAKLDNGVRGTDAGVLDRVHIAYRRWVDFYDDFARERGERRVRGGR